MRILSILLLMLPTSLFAQDEASVHHTPRSNYLFPEEADPAYILRSDVTMRDGPSKDAAVIGSLNVGDRVTIELADTKEEVINGITSSWYKVAVDKRTGWVWGGHIAQRTFGSHADPAVKFLGGIDAVTYSDTSGSAFIYRLVALREGKEIDRFAVRSFAHGFDEVMNRGNLGLRTVDDIFFLRVPCVGGCGCTTGEVVVFWSDNKFHHVADLMGSPDGDFSTNTSFIFPADMEGLPETVIRWTNDHKDLDENEESDNSILRISTRDYLRWNGTALVNSGVPTDERTYELSLDRD
ncbi:MAG: SH3 domain-containing protein [Flavobacteriales bacterium]|nr:SH3 domain-containing protein [Flavobacteriales bacterium]